MATQNTTSQKIAGLMPIITIAAALLLLAAGYFLLLLPKIRPILAGGDLDPALLRAQLAERRSYSAKIAASYASFKGINEEKKQRLAAVIPTSPDVPGLLVTLDAIAKESEFVMTSIDTVVDETTFTPGGSRMVRISVNMAGGTYPQFRTLLANLSRSLRLLDVQSVVFTPNNGNYAMVMRAYYYPPPTVDGSAPPAS